MQQFALKKQMSLCQMPTPEKFDREKKEERSVQIKGIKTNRENTVWDK